MPWVGLQSVIVAFPGHTHLLFSVMSQVLELDVDLVHSSNDHNIVRSLICRHA